MGLKVLALLDKKISRASIAPTRTSVRVVVASPSGVSVQQVRLAIERTVAMIALSLGAADILYWSWKISYYSKRRFSYSGAIGNDVLSGPASRI